MICKEVQMTPRAEEARREEAREGGEKKGGTKKKVRKTKNPVKPSRKEGSKMSFSIFN